MKIALASDLHLEFGDIILKNTENAEVLILSGDICVAIHLMDEGAALAHKSERIHNFFKQVCTEFPNVIYIMGNHEHYNGDFATTHSILQERLGYLTNLNILDKQRVTIGDLTFVGGTLWTDMNGEDRHTLYSIRKMMNDFRCVKNSNKMQDKDHIPKFTPENAVEDHRSMLKLIHKELILNPDGKFVVIGHHAPSKKSTHPRYQDDTIMNGGYSSSLDFWIEDRPQIKLWTHGHTHEPFDYVIGETRVVCNPRGYDGYEQRADDFKLKFIEVA